MAKAYEELFGTIFSEEDLTKLEWAIGSVLAQGTAKFTTIYGLPATGKSTAISLVQKIMYDQKVQRPVIIANEPRPDLLRRWTRSVPAFVASYNPVQVATRDGSNPLLEIRTTGTTVDRNHYFVLQDEMRSELGAIAQRCARRYLDLGATYYDNTEQENNK